MLKYSFLWLVLSGFWSGNSKNSADIEDIQGKMNAKIMHCHDGDTCRVKIEDKMWMNIRLAGIDAPEVAKKRQKNSGQNYGEAARDFLNDLLKGKAVQLQQTDLDHYNRPVVEIFLDQSLVNLVMIEKGLAEAYRGPAKRLDKVKYSLAEEKAKQNKLGIWSQTKYESPHEYRRKMKAESKK